MDDDRPFGYDTLKLRAVFVPEGDRDKVSMADITAALGYDAVKVPVIFVPEGSEEPRPGYPYVHVGRCVMRGDGRVDMLGPVPGDAERGGWAAGPMQGAGDTGDAPAKPPVARAMPPTPTPTLAQAQSYFDPAKTAIATWRRLAASAGADRAVPSSTRSQLKRPSKVEQFFETRAIYEEMAKRLDTNAEFLMALSSWESGWMDAHNRALHNLFGVTHAGANNLSFASDQEAANYWVTHYGSYVRGAKTMDEFVAGLRCAHYNPHPEYYGAVKRQLDTVRKYLNADKPE